MPSFSSAAAFSVKVNAMMFAGATWGSVAGLSRFDTNLATTSVFPDPAQAMSWRFPLV